MEKSRYCASEQMRTCMRAACPHLHVYFLKTFFYIYTFYGYAYKHQTRHLSARILYVGFTACLMLQIAATSATKYCFDSFIEEIPPVSAI